MVVIACFSSAVPPSASPSCLKVVDFALGLNTPRFFGAGGGALTCMPLGAGLPAFALRSASSTAARPHLLIIAWRMVARCRLSCIVLYIFCVAFAKPKDP